MLATTALPRSDLGERIGIRRRQHGLSRKVVANLVGRSEEWLRQVERRQRRLDSIEVLLHLARVLHIEDVTEFLGWRPATAAKAPAAGSLIEDLRAGLMDSLALRSLRPGVHAVPPPLPVLRAELEHAWEVWQQSSSRQAQLAVLLPRLLRRLRSAWISGDRSGELVLLLARAYGLARYLADELGDQHLAWIAADHCLAMAERSDDVAELGAAIVHRTACMRAMHYATEAYKFAVEYADRVDDPAIRGALLLQAAEAAADANQRFEANRLLDLARAIAGDLGTDITRSLVLFGPSEVGIREVRIAMRLGQFDSAVRLARDVSLPQDLPVERQATHLITMAFAYARARDDVAAVFALNRVATLSPDDLRFNPLARAAIQRLAHRGHVLIADDLTRLSTLARVS